jgi:hypothetical protein
MQTAASSYSPFLITSFVWQEATHKEVYDLIKRKLGHSQP